MKKTLIITALLMATCGMAVNAAETTQHPKPQPTCNCQRPPKGPDFAKRNAEFEKRLKLTDEQKAKAKELRQKGFEEMKPLMDKIKEKRAEIETVKLSRISVQAQNEKIEQLKKEIGALRNEMHRLRMENMKNFEAILTKSQLKELKKMKEEGRKKFDKEFKNHPKQGGHHGPEHRPMPLPDHRPVE